MSLCTLTLEGSGTALVPTHTTLAIPEKNCATLDIRVTAHLPQTLTMSKEEFMPSLVPCLRIRTHSSGEWITASSAIAAPTIHLSSSSLIQQALNEAPPGSTLLVAPGRYFENLRITKPVNLRGSGPADQTKLFGSIWVLSTSHVTVDGVCVYPLDQPSAGLRITSSADVFIQNCIVTQDLSQKFLVSRKNASGIYASHSSGVHFTNNILRGYGFGLYLDECHGCMVRTNVFCGCWNALGVARCDGLTLTGNWFRENMAVVLSLEGGAGGYGLAANGNMFEDNAALDVVGGYSLPLGSGSVLVEELQRRSEGGGGESERKEAKVVVRGTCMGSEDLKTSEYCASIQGME